jgi:hypothetical protein
MHLAEKDHAANWRANESSHHSAIDDMMTPVSVRVGFSMKVRDMRQNVEGVADVIGLFMSGIACVPGNGA